MPEGDTLHRIANALGPRLVGQPVRSLLLRHQSIDRLTGHLVTKIEARGKNLLVFFDEGTVLHTHLRMGGAWHLYGENERWRRSPTFATVVLAVPGLVAVCFRAPVARLVRASLLAGDPAIGRPGPDLIAPAFDEAAALTRLRRMGHKEIGDALMDQQVVAGIGNVYKSEILFHERLDPFAPVDAHSDEELARLLAFARRIMVANATAKPHASGPGAHNGHTRTTREGARPGEGPLSVYRRAGEPCYDCGALIEMRRQGEARRSTYSCPRCQAPRRAAHREAHA
ncbi:Fpg/Nei family DNA glycosylase [Polyangium jinanense]|uniref:DNA-(apurinic or apyrimidinic site) lyase n=1 Tax=Polyangium jinanense TaxID=2829994 RepID=A0A9X3XEH2_9BACT|nr:DNA-formamidopyrimidine glycosylase family protein [Polyangium jinanense]MDC3961590.1 Fpg/Nei family DNA glycosylase [Polyangium jinanense]MDC3987955.1 Fpg/Nei family DNA glycosylase [Polyangium jinanense]